VVKRKGGFRAANLVERIKRKRFVKRFGWKINFNWKAQPSRVSLEKRFWDQVQNSLRRESGSKSVAKR
jgi:hypothetical protein